MRGFDETNHDMYGGHLGTIKSYIETHFKELINKQMINLDYSTILPQDELDKFRFILCSKEMWFKEDIYEVCRKNNIVIPKNLFAWQNLEKIGFKNASNYITSTKYESAKEYFEQEYFSKDFLDTTTMDRRLTYIVVFSGSSRLRINFLIMTMKIFIKLEKFKFCDS